MDPHSEPSAMQPGRDFAGYAGDPPKANWPNGARLALNFVLNIEEGSEPSVPDGDGYTENRLTDSSLQLGASLSVGRFHSRSLRVHWHSSATRRSLPRSARPITTSAVTATAGSTIENSTPKLNGNRSALPSKASNARSGTSQLVGIAAMGPRSIHAG